MTPFTLIRRSLRYHLRAHLGVLLGTAVGAAVLIGALLVGDSVRESLKEMALQRLGRVQVAMMAGDRLFRESLATEMSDGKSLQLAPVLQLPATAGSADGEARANRVQVLGVNELFWSLANTAPGFANVQSNAVVLNQPLADQLRVKKGDTVLLRVPKPSKLSRDAPLSPEEDTSVALRLEVQDIVADDAFGRFSLQANQIAPFNAFVPLALLQQRVGATNRANLLLAASTTGSAVQPAELDTLLRKHWKSDDADLKFIAGQKGEIEMRTGRVFLDPPVVQAAAASVTNGRPILTYFVNELRVGTNTTPYSMVTAAQAPLVPADLKDNEIVINQWVADDLHAKPGDALSVRYYFVGEGRKLEERTNTFTIRSIVPLEGAYADKTLMPDFPGMTDAANCRDWDTGFPIKTDAIRDKDEKYWTDHKGTPKAFISLNAGQTLWSNRFGNLTAVRFDNTGKSTNDLGTAVLAKLDPASLNLRFEPVRELAMRAGAQAQDFGGLFIGFSFFLIVAALLLTALLFQFGVEQRIVETGTLLAIGYTPKLVKRLLLLEGLVIAVIGSLIGVAGGVAYARGMLHGLTTIWRDAVGTDSLSFHATTATLIGGFVGSVLVALFTLWLALRKQLNQPARELLAGEIHDTGSGTTTKVRAPKMAIGSAVMAVVLLAAAFKQEGEAAAGSFFGAGALLLIAALSFGSFWLRRIAIASSAAVLTLPGLGVRNTTRRRKRSLATIAMLASGAFLIISIGAFRLDENENATKRSSGTGGFAFLGETSLAVHHDLNGSQGREFYNLAGKEMDEVKFVPLRVRDGDDASCLNLNRAQKPRLLGVNPAMLSDRDAFTFAKVADGVDKAKPWMALKATAPGQPVPAIADMNSILWALGKKVGDTIPYVDERGNAFDVKLVGAVANSILQGNLIIDESEFVKRFPGESGYRMFLVDAPSNAANTVSTQLTKALRDVGLELTPAPKRLAAFNAVQNTYLSTFQVLGGLGLILGSVGLGVVVLRNVLERRAELGVMKAIGFRPGSLQWLVLSEHGALLLAGLFFGVVAAAMAVLPALLAPGSALPYHSLGLTLGGVLLSGAAWTWLATVIALRGGLMDALRNE
ncbi:MAG TPA: ABC transporter permease [Roseimicrobium sp.]|nr:ABC transporter permease [Roseimicrobium sp.]